MAAKAKKNTRCPLQSECERKCEYINKELDCDYYRNNAVGDNVIPDQEELLKLRNKLDDDKRFEEELKSIDIAEEDPVVVDAFNVSETCGDLSGKAEIRMIPLGDIVPSSDNMFTVEDDITALTEDIKVNGLLSPLTVCQDSDEKGTFYRIISGHRRFKALGELYESAVEVPCLVTAPKSPEAEEYMLIQANISSREIGWREKEVARAKCEKLLLDLKKQGHEFPGKLRTHVAKLLKTSEAQLAKGKYINEHIIEDLKDVPDERLSFEDRYMVSHWSEDLQKTFYDKHVKDKIGKVMSVWYYNDRIKEGKNPFEDKPDSNKAKNVKICWYGENHNNECLNAENFAVYKGVPINKFGVTFTCTGGCCYYCANHHICPGVCKNAQVKLKEDLEDYDCSFELYKTRLALRHLLLQKGFDAAKLKDRAELEEIELDSDFEDLVKYPLSNGLDVVDLLWYLSVLEMTPNEFFDIVKNHTDGPRKLENDIKPTWEIYLGKESEDA